MVEFGCYIFMKWLSSTTASTEEPRENPWGEDAEK